MRLSPRVGVALCLSSLLCGCLTTQELWTNVQQCCVGCFQQSLGGCLQGNATASPPC